MSRSGLAWRLALAVAGLTLPTTSIVWGVQGYLNWLAVADQLEGLFWMLAATASLTSVIFAIFRGRRLDPSPPEEPAFGSELAVAHAISLYANVSPARGMRLAPGFMNHLRTMGYEVRPTDDVVGTSEMDRLRERFISMDLSGRKYSGGSDG